MAQPPQHARHAPPPSKFGNPAPVQAKSLAQPARAPVTHAPPPTKFGAAGAAQRQTNASPAHHPPPPAFETAATVQAKHLPAIGRPLAILQPMNQSGFNSTTTYSGQIYGIYFNPQFDTDDRVTMTDLSMDQCLYVGKTITKDVGDRFIQHVNEDDDMPWYKDNCSDGAYASGNDDYWEYVPRQLWDLKKVTAFDVAAAEQYYMQAGIKAGANLRNKVNALAARKYTSFKKKKNIFTTSKEYGTWEPEDLSSVLKKLAKKRDDDGIY